MASNVGDAYCSIGIVTKPKGLKGSLKVVLYDSLYIKHLQNTKVLFFQEEGVMIPRFISNIANSNNVVTICFEDIDSRGQAKELINKELFVPKDELSKSIGTKHCKGLDLLGYMVIDTKLGKIGTIEEVLRYPSQDLASLSYKGKSILIPLVNDFILSVNSLDRCVIMELPVGILDI